VSEGGNDRETEKLKGSRGKKRKKDERGRENEMDRDTCDCKKRDDITI